MTATRTGKPSVSLIALIGMVLTVGVGRAGSIQLPTTYDQLIPPDPNPDNVMPTTSVGSLTFSNFGLPASDVTANNIAVSAAAAAMEMGLTFGGPMGANLLTANNPSTSQSSTLSYTVASAGFADAVLSFTGIGN
jgi:hypothetical protein